MGTCWDYKWVDDLEIEKKQKMGDVMLDCLLEKLEKGNSNL